MPARAPSPLRIALIVLALLGVVAAGWFASTHDAWRGRSDQSAPLPQAERVTLRREPCFGGCPVYAVTVERSGRVSYRTTHYAVGSRGVEETREVRQARMPAPALAALLRAVESDAYARLRPDYSVDATDLPATVLEVSGGGAARRTRVYGVPCRSEPDAVPGDHGTRVPDIFCRVTELMDAASCAKYWSVDASPWPPAQRNRPLPTPPRCGALP